MPEVMTLEVKSEESEEGEEHLIVEVEDATHGLDGFRIVGACAPDLIHVPHGLLRQFVKPDGVLFHGEDVDIDALLLPHAVVAVLLQHP